MRVRQAIVAVLGLAMAACSYGQPRTSVSSATTPPTPRVTFVTIGSDATLGAELEDPLHDLWSQQLFAAELPPQAVYVNLAIRGATAADALNEQVPVALELRPTIVTVWLTGDLDQGSPTDRYGADLTRVVERLQASGATVLVASGWPPDGVATRVAAATGATLVDLSAIPGRGLDGPAEQEAIAAAFAPQLGVDAG